MNEIVIRVVVEDERKRQREEDVRRAREAIRTLKEICIAHEDCVNCCLERSDIGCKIEGSPQRWHEEWAK